jgi:hypothetical protein
MDTAKKVKKIPLTDEQWEEKFRKFVDPKYYTMDRMTFGGSNSTSLKRVSMLSGFTLKRKHAGRIKNQNSAGSLTSRIHKSKSRVYRSGEVEVNIGY